MNAIIEKSFTSSTQSSFPKVLEPSNLPRRYLISDRLSNYMSRVNSRKKRRREEKLRHLVELAAAGDDEAALQFSMRLISKSRNLAVECTHILKTFGRHRAAETIVSRFLNRIPRSSAEATTALLLSIYTERTDRSEQLLRILQTEEDESSNLLTIAYCALNENIERLDKISHQYARYIDKNWRDIARDRDRLDKLLTNLVHFSHLLEDAQVRHLSISGEDLKSVTAFLKFVIAKMRPTQRVLKAENNRRKVLRIYLRLYRICWKCRRKTELDILRYYIAKICGTDADLLAATARVMQNLLDPADRQFTEEALYAAEQELGVAKPFSEKYLNALQTAIRMTGDLKHEELHDYYVEIGIKCLTQATLAGAPPQRFLGLARSLLEHKRGAEAVEIWLENVRHGNGEDHPRITQLRLMLERVLPTASAHRKVISIPVEGTARRYRPIAWSMLGSGTVGELVRGDQATSSSYDTAKLLVASRLHSHADVLQFKRFRASRSATEFINCTENIINRGRKEKTEKLKGIVVYCHYRCLATLALTALPVAELRRRGYEAIALTGQNIQLAATGYDWLDHFQGFLESATRLRDDPYHPNELIYQWSIDWENRRVCALGMNFYQPLFERLTRWSGRYQLHIESVGVQRLIKSMILMLDRAIYACEELRKETANRGIPVRFVSANWQFPPVAAYRIYCETYGKDANMEFVACSPGYENYYSNLGEAFSNTAAVLNITAHPTTRAPFLPIKERFEAWLANQDHQAILQDSQVHSWIKADRAGVSQTRVTAAANIVRRVESHRAKGGKVICVFGKIVYDLSVPYTGGPAHRDMADWINHTVAAAKNAPNTLVLIKPHPHELRYEIAGRPDQYFLDMIKQPIPPNVILLEHRWFNMRDVIEMIDLGILWNGTTGLELGAAGIPVVVCDDWAIRDYPVGHFTPRNREHYEEIIRNPSNVKMPDTHRLLCAALLKYMSTDEVMRPYQYARRGVTNADVGLPDWRLELVEQYFAQGDMYVSLLADDFGFPQ
jgi:hypothetical protein